MSDALLRLAVRAFPRDLRRRDGAVVLDCAREMVDAGASAPAEAAGIATTGVRARLRRAAGPAVHAPWGTVLDRLALPLAAAALLLFAAGGAEFAYTGRWWPAVVAAAATALVGAAIRSRAVAVAGWSALLAADLYSVVGQYLTHSGGRFSASIGSFGVDAQAAALPMLALGLATAVARRRDGRRVFAPAAVLIAAAATAAAVSRVNTVDSTVLTAVLVLLLAAPVLVVVRALWTRRPETMTAAALLVAVSAHEIVWLSTGFVPYPGPAGALALLAVGGLLSAAAVVALSRGAGVRAR